jgi:hypothetical protein
MFETTNSAGAIAASRMRRPRAVVVPRSQFTSAAPVRVSHHRRRLLAAHFVAALAAAGLGAPAVAQPRVGGTSPDPQLVAHPCEERTDLYADGVVDYVIRFRYDDRGDLVAEERDDLADGSVDQRTSYTYAAPGMPGEVAVDADADGTVDAVTRFEYDAGGRLLREVQDSDADGVPDWIYEQRYPTGRGVPPEAPSVGEVSLPGEGLPPAEIATFVRDERGRVIEERVSWSDDDGAESAPDEVPELIVRYGYEGDVLRLIEEDFDADGIVDLRTVRQYDANGRLLREEWESDALDTVRGRTIYWYDTAERLIRVEFDSWADGELDARTELRYDCAEPIGQP